MANFEEIRIEGFQSGLVTDPSATDIALDAATTATNCDFTSAGKLKKSRGLKSFGLPTIPTGLTVEAFYEFHITNPADKDITIIFGANGGRDRFYISPYWDDLTAAWVTNAWLELTEALFTTVTTKNTATSYDLAAATGLSASDNYHNKWYVVFFSSADAFIGYDYIKTYTASSRNIATKYGVAGTAATDKVLLMRFPLYEDFSTGNTLVPCFSVDSKPVFVQHGEHIYIYTGSSKSQVTGIDLWLGFIGTSSAVQGYFDDDDLNFRGFCMEHAHPYKPIQTSGDEWINTVTAGNEATDPVPYNSSTTEFIAVTALLYDGFQESNIYFDETTTFTHTVTLPDDTTAVTVNWSASYQNGLRRSPEWTVYTQRGYFFSRRITRILLYGGMGKLVSAGNAKLATPLFQLKDISIDDSGWTGTGPYTLSTTIKGIQWEIAQQLPQTINYGRTVEKIGANADFGGQVGGNYVVGPIYADQEYRDVLIIAPLSGVLVGKNLMPNILPLSLWLRFKEQGIYDILYWVELNGRLVVFGANTLAVAEIDGINSRIVEQFQKRGLVSARAVQVIDGIAYYAGVESIYAFDGNQITDIGDRIKTEWQTISLANRQAAISGFNRRLKQFFLQAGSTLYVYSTLQNNWKTESLDKTWTYFANGVDGEFLGTDGTDIFQLDATSYTTARALTWKSRHFDSSRIKPRRLRASYKSSDTLTVKLYDVELNSSTPIETMYLLPASSEAHIDYPVSFESTRVQIEVVSSSSTNDDTEIDYLSLAGTVRNQR